MAGHCNLQILLLSVCIICQITTTSEQWPPAPDPTQCSYTVKQFKSGFQFNMISSTNGTYTINVLEERTQTKRVNGFSSQTTSYEVQHLKPCTEYEPDVTFVDGAGKETICNITGNKKMRTNDISKNEIKVDNCRPGYVCYQSDWDISFSIFSSNTVSAERCNSYNKPCIKLSETDFCSDLTTTFKSGYCSFNLINSITVDFFDPNEKQNFLNKLPVEIKPTLPPNCKSLSIDYTCLDINLSESKTLSELEPFTDYNCTGQIKQNNVNIKNTTTFHFRVDCDLTIEIYSIRQTNTSIDLSWTTNTSNCLDVSKLQKLSYDCKCASTESKQKQIPGNKHPSAGTCRFTNLKPFTRYTCEVQPTYNNKEVSKVKTESVETEIGTPEKVTNLEAKVYDQNTIIVTCRHRRDFNGPEVDKPYIAQLYYKGDNSELQTITNRTCHFEFKDLSYSNSYTVKVKVSNGKLESSPWIEHVDTLYNTADHIRYPIAFVFITISVAVMVYICKIKKKRCQRTDDVNVMFKKTASYVNVPPEIH